jgi:hypothetical protein
MTCGLMQVAMGDEGVVFGHSWRVAALHDSYERGGFKGPEKVVLSDLLELFIKAMRLFAGMRLLLFIMMSQ